MKNLQFKIFILFLLIFVLSGIAVAQGNFAGGKGTEKEPYLVKTPEHLNNVRDYLDGHFRQIADINLNEDYDLIPGWKPIGNYNENKPFTGSFNGNGHFITGLYIEREDYDNIGLFQFIGENATVKNINIKNYDITGNEIIGVLCGRNDGNIINCNVNNGTIRGGGSYVNIGGLIGVSSGVIDNCSVLNSSLNGDGRIGGLVGKTYDCEIRNSFTDLSLKKNQLGHIGGLIASGSNVLIKNSHSIINIAFNIEEDTSYSDGAGGLVGSLLNDSKIKDSYAEVDISGKAIDWGIGYNVGGLIGLYNAGDIINSYSEGKIEGDFETIGGLIGELDGPAKAESSHAKVDIITEGDKIGGLVGYMSDNNAEIKNCYAIGNIQGNEEVGGLIGAKFRGAIIDSYAEGDVSGNEFVGGLVGHLITSYQDESIDLKNSYSNGKVTGDTAIGGLVGKAGRDANDTALIIKCQAYGDVEGTNMVGGLVGDVRNANITKSSSEGKIIGEEKVGGLVGRYGRGISEFNFSSSDVTGITKVGGFIGESTPNRSYHEEALIKNCYSAGNVNGDSSLGGFIGENISNVSNCYSAGSVSNGEDAGAFIGINIEEVTIKNCFYDKDKSGVKISDGGFPRATKQMMQKETFSSEDWDFNKIWSIKENKSYPYLQWQDENIPIPDDKSDKNQKKEPIEIEKIQSSERGDKDGTKKSLENWKVNPYRLDFGEKVKLSYNLHNDSEETEKYIVKPVLIKPDGSQKDDLNSRLIELKPHQDKILSWEVSPSQMGNWDLNFLIWDYEVLEKIVWELYKEDTDWKKIGSKFLLGSYLQRKGPFKDAFLVTNEDISKFRKKLERSRKHIFTTLEIPDQKNWAGEFIDKHSGVEAAYRRALNIHMQAQNNWKKAESYLQQNNLEAANKFLNLALTDNCLAHSILTDSEDIFIEVAKKGEKATYILMRGCQESAKFIALLHFGPEGYKAASKVVMVQDYIHGVFTEGWSEASKDLSAQIVTDLLIDKSGILETLNAQEAIAEKEIYDRLKHTLSRSDFVEQLLWEYTANGLVSEIANSGSQQLLDNILKETQNRLTVKIKKLKNKH